MSEAWHYAAKISMAAMSARAGAALKRRHAFVTFNRDYTSAVFYSRAGDDKSWRRAGCSTLSPDRRLVNATVRINSALRLISLLRL